MKRILCILLCLALCIACAGEPILQNRTAAPTEATVIEQAPEIEAIAIPVATPEHTPVPVPTPTPTPEPTQTPEPTKDPNRPMVALTFDDGPNLTLTEAVLEKLREYNVVATFYLLASAINDKSGPMLQHMIDQGCEIGVHGWNHNDMTTFSSSENCKRLLKAADEISGWIEGGYTPKTMRPPGGKTSGSVYSGARAANMAVVKWSVDTADWLTQNEKKIMEVVKKKTRNGAIILCHDHHAPTLNVLDEMIPWLLEQGYDLVTVSELIESSGEEIQPGRNYRWKPGCEP